MREGSSTIASLNGPCQFQCVYRTDRLLVPCVKYSNAQHNITRSLKSKVKLGNLEIT